MGRSNRLFIVICASSILSAAPILFAQASPAANQIINTIADTGVTGNTGNGGPALVAKLNDPNGVAVDPNNGTIYVADSGNNVVRAINPQTGIVSVYACGGTASGAKSQVSRLIRGKLPENPCRAMQTLPIHQETSPVPTPHRREFFADRAKFHLTGIACHKDTRKHWQSFLALLFGAFLRRFFSADHGSSSFLCQKPACRS